MKNIIWTARYIGAPTAVRYCKRCGADSAFASSGLFRVNAQQKALDVWLIYKCPDCGVTWNMTVLSRVAPRSLPPELLEGFHRNDAELALRYATDRALIKRNGAAPGSARVELEGEPVDLIAPARIELTAPWPCECRAAAAIRGKLELSGSEFDRLCDSGRLVCLSGQDLKRCRLTGTIVMELR